MNTDKTKIVMKMFISHRILGVLFERQKLFWFGDIFSLSRSYLLQTEQFVVLIQLVFE